MHGLRNSYFIAMNQQRRVYMHGLRNSYFIAMNQQRSRGSATPMKMGGGRGTRRQRSQDFLQRVTHTKKSNTRRIWPTIFLKMGGGDYPPHSQKWGGRVPPRPPCGGAPAEKGHRMIILVQRLTRAWPPLSRTSLGTDHDRAFDALLSPKQKWLQ